MYLNIIVGLVFIGLVGWIARDFLRSLKSPARIMKDELEQRREQQEQPAANIERLREAGLEKLTSLRTAIEEMNEALPLDEQFSIEHTDDSVTIAFADSYLFITYKLMQFSLDASDEDFSDDIAMYQAFIIERKDLNDNLIIQKEAATEEEAIRLIAREIATIVEP